jgi:hypothetical protein
MIPSSYRMGWRIVPPHPDDEWGLKESTRGEKILKH